VQKNQNSRETQRKGRCRGGRGEGNKWTVGKDPGVGKQFGPRKENTQKQVEKKPTSHKGDYQDNKAQNRVRK